MLIMMLLLHNTIEDCFNASKLCCLFDGVKAKLRGFISLPVSSNTIIVFTNSNSISEQ